jgi:hypothetical protein
MTEIKINKEEFLEFNQQDQFQFFYQDNGLPYEDTVEDFNENVEKLFQKYDYLLINPEDEIYGIKENTKELIMGLATEAYEIAMEIKEL